MQTSTSANGAKHYPIVTHKPIKVAAKVQAAVIAQLKASGEPLTSNDLSSHSSIQGMNLGANGLYNYLSSMHKAGLLKRVPISRTDQPNAKFGYELGEGMPEKKAPSEQKPETREEGRRRRRIERIRRKSLIDMAPAQKPAMTVDFIKSSGRVRIELNGLFIELGVIA